MPEVGGKGQERLRQARVLVVGAGGLGSPASMYLAAAGIGTLGIVDCDQVELSNLQRQILHRSQDVGVSKAESAVRALTALNPGVRVQPYQMLVRGDNVQDLLAAEDWDVVVDGVDNFVARYLLNDACVLAGIPLVEAGILRFDGMVMTIVPGEGPCYRCVFPEPPAPGTIPTCSEAGVIGSLAGTIGVLQATEAIKLILGIGRPLTGRILTYNALEGTFRTIAWEKSRSCPLCGRQPTIIRPVEYQLACDLRSVGNDDGDRPEIDARSAD